MAAIYDFIQCFYSKRVKNDEQKLKVMRKTTVLLSV